jgi:hypothetical protein
MTINEPKPDVLHPKHTALDIAQQCTHDDDGDYTYKAIPWGPVYWVVAVSDEIGIVGYL